MIAKVKELGVWIRILDIGGGFPIHYKTNDWELDIYEFCEPIRRELEDLDDGIRVIAEPGWFLCAPTLTAVCSVIGKDIKEGVWWYYLDDGILGTFIAEFTGDEPHFVEFDKEGPTFPSVFAGPSLVDIDIVWHQINAPLLEVGDWITTHM